MKTRFTIFAAPTSDTDPRPQFCVCDRNVIVDRFSNRQQAEQGAVRREAKATA